MSWNIHLSILCTDAPTTMLHGSYGVLGIIKQLLFLQNQQDYFAKDLLSFISVYCFCYFQFIVQLTADFSFTFPGSSFIKSCMTRISCGSIKMSPEFC